MITGKVSNKTSHATELESYGGLIIPTNCPTRYITIVPRKTCLEMSKKLHIQTTCKSTKNEQTFQR